MKTVEELLKSHLFFDGMREEHLQTLSACGDTVHFASRETIFREGEEANLFYIILLGKVAVDIQASHRGSITIQTIDAGEILGWSWLIPPYKWRFNARAVEDTSAIVMDGRCLRGRFEQDSRLGYELFRRFAQVFSKRLEYTILQLLDLYCANPMKKTKIF